MATTHKFKQYIIIIYKQDNKRIPERLAPVLLSSILI